MKEIRDRLMVFGMAALFTCVLSLVTVDASSRPTRDVPQVLSKWINGK